MPRRIADRCPPVAIATLLIICLLSLGGCSVGPPRGVEPVTPFELDRYLGTWYEIARLDHSFERDLNNVKAQYSELPDGSVEVVNRGYNTEQGRWQEAVGKAKFTGDADTGSLKVSFFGPFYGGYHIVALDQQDYRWAMVMGQDRDYLWILARNKTLPDEVRDRLVERAEGLGINVDELIWVEQSRSPEAK